MLEPSDKVPFDKLSEAATLNALFHAMREKSVEEAINHYRLFLQNYITQASGRQKYILTCWSERALRQYIDTSVLRDDLSDAELGELARFICKQLLETESVSELLGVRTMLIHYVLHRYPAHYRPFTGDEIQAIKKKTGKEPFISKKRVDYPQATHLVRTIDNACDNFQPALEAHLGPPEHLKKSAGLMLFTAEYEPFLPDSDERFERWFDAPYRERCDVVSKKEEKISEPQFFLKDQKQTLFSAFQSLAQKFETEDYNCNVVGTRFNYYLDRVGEARDIVALTKHFDVDNIYFDDRQIKEFKDVLELRLARDNEKRTRAVAFDGPT